MSEKPKDPSQELCLIMDAVSDPILEMSDEEILAEENENGESPGEVATQVKALLLDALKAYKQRRLHSAQLEYELETARIEHHTSNIPSSPQEQRQLLSLLFARQPELLTLQNRDFQELTDSDVERLLIDLQALGALDNLTKRDGESK